jgi:hypothetical protein
LTPELQHILGFICFELGSMAHIFQALGEFEGGDGVALKKRAEDEQAFMLHRWLTFWWENPETWKAKAVNDLEDARSRLAAKAAA